MLCSAGIYDLRPLLDGLAAGGTCNARQLEGFAKSLEAALALRARACQLKPSSLSTAAAAVLTPTSAAAAGGGGVLQRGKQHGEAAASSSSSSNGRSGSISSSSSVKGRGGSKARARGGTQQQQEQQHHHQQQQQGVIRYPSLAALAQGVLEEEQVTLDVIRSCIR